MYIKDSSKINRQIQNQAKKLVQVFKSIGMNFKYQLQNVKQSVVEIQT
jgi:hypothetical protein